MDDAGLFFPLCDSAFLFKLSEAKLKADRGKLDLRVFAMEQFDRNGGTLKAKSGDIKTISTMDSLGSKDLLLLQWYMDFAGIYKAKGWKLADFPRGKKVRIVKGTFRAAPVICFKNDLTRHQCIRAYTRLLEIINDIDHSLHNSSSNRLPKGGAAGLVFFLCKSRATLPPGPLRRWCNSVIHHFDPVEEPEEDNDIDALADTMSEKLSLHSRVSKEKKKETALSLPREESNHKRTKHKESIAIRKEKVVAIPKKEKVAIVIASDEESEEDSEDSEDTQENRLSVLSLPSNTISAAKVLPKQKVKGKPFKSTDHPINKVYISFKRGDMSKEKVASIFRKNGVETKAVVLKAGFGFVTLHPGDVPLVLQQQSQFQPLSVKPMKTRT